MSATRTTRLSPAQLRVLQEAEEADGLRPLHAKEVRTVAVLRALGLVTLERVLMVPRVVLTDAGRREVSR